MRTALILLLLLGIASIPGSIIPQRTQNPFQVQDFFEANPTISPWLDRFYLFDVFGAPWFSGVYILLFISLIGCLVPRLNQYRKEIFERPSEPPRTLDRGDGFFEVEGDLDQVVTWLKSKRYRVERFPSDESHESQSGSLTGEKGYLKEFGNLLFHLSLLLILVGIAMSSLFGMRGEAIVNEGERFINTPVAYDNIAPGRLYSLDSLSPYRIDLVDFTAQYNPVTNQPIDYSLKVKIRDDLEATVREDVIKVNRPLTFGASRVFLQATGYSVVVTVRDKEGEIAFQGPVPMLPQDPNLTSAGAIKVPDMDPGIGFVASFLPTFQRDPIRGAFSIFPEVLDPRLLLAAWQGDLGMDEGKPQSIYRLDTSKMERIALISLKPGESYDFKVGSITFDGYLPWVNLQVIHDPGKLPALIGGFLAIAGALGMLFVHRRRIWIRFRTIGGKQVLAISGLAQGNAEKLSEDLAALRKFLESSEEGGIKR
jgi:cytochrome c biogenesis protein